MPGTTPDSQVVEFYNDAKVFITGGTGFFGKVLTEKLLRLCSVNHIYLLVRTKKGKDPQTRLNELLEDPAFDRLRKDKPGFEKKVSCIPGDVGFEKLNLSESDYEFLANEVTHVFHSAATVRFTEKLKKAIEINVLGTLEVVEFCKKCIRLKVFVHISTAYSHCERGEIAEVFYDPPMPANKALDLAKTLSEEKLDSITTELIKPWPNTYSYTKAIAESIIQECTFPTVIFRPGIVTGAFKEPADGYIDNIYGPTGIIIAVGIGLLRVVNANANLVANVIPVDTTINGIMSSAWEVGSYFNNNSTVDSLTEADDGTEICTNGKCVPRIYNLAVDENNSITWSDYTRLHIKYGARIPSSKAIWYFTLTFVKSKTVYLFLALFLHLIPAALVDGVCILLGKKPQLWKGYQKIHLFSKILTFFAMRTWKFHTVNTNRLYSRLNDTDKKLFDFDVSKIDWDLYAINVVSGVRRFLLKESDDTIPAGKRRMIVLWILHRALQGLLVALLFWILSKSLFSFDDLNLRFREPALMHSGFLRNST